MIVVWLFLTMPLVCLQFVVVVFPDHTHSPFFLFQIFQYWNKNEGPALPSSNHVFERFSFNQFGRSLGDPFSQTAFNSDLLHNMRHFIKKTKLPPGGRFF